MTTNQTIDGVSRKLLAEALAGFEALGIHAYARELRALLDADKVNNRQMGLMQFVEAHPIKPARHPDAIIEGVMTSAGISHAIFASTVSLKHGEQVKLYAVQPAPVAVVIPERKRADHCDESQGVKSYFEELGWNACLDELKRLNPSL